VGDQTKLGHELMSSTAAAPYGPVAFDEWKQTADVCVPVHACGRKVSHIVQQRTNLEPAAVCSGSKCFFYLRVLGRKSIIINIPYFSIQSRRVVFSGSKCEKVLASWMCTVVIIWMLPKCIFNR
jgi:hypothetical protein